MYSIECMNFCVYKNNANYRIVKLYDYYYYYFFALFLVPMYLYDIFIMLYTCNFFI